MNHLTAPALSLFRTLQCKRTYPAVLALLSVFFSTVVYAAENVSTPADDASLQQADNPARQQQDAAPTSPVECDFNSEDCRRSAAADSSELTRRLDLVDAIRYSQGVYHPSLIEAHIQVAALYSEEGLLEQALNELQEALLVARNIGGPFGATQVPVLEAMTWVYVEMGDWHRAAELQQLKLESGRRSFEPTDWRHTEVLFEYTQWILPVVEADLLKLDASQFTELSDELDQQFERALDVIDSNTPGTDLARATLLYNQARILLAVVAKYNEKDYYRVTRLVVETIPRTRYVNRCRAEMVENRQVTQCSPEPETYYEQSTQRVPLAPEMPRATREQAEAALERLPGKLQQLRNIIRDSTEFTANVGKVIGDRLQALEEAYAALPGVGE